MSKVTRPFADVFLCHACGWPMSTQEGRAGFTAHDLCAGKPTKCVAFAPILETSVSSVLVHVTKDVAGYTPIKKTSPLGVSFPTYEAAAEAAVVLNEKLGLSFKEGVRIVSSTMGGRKA